MTRQAGLAIPQHYFFHPGRTSVLREGQEDAAWDSTRSRQTYDAVRQEHVGEGS
jgi:hypothetical protein